MLDKKNNNLTPKPIGPYRSIVVHNDLIFTSGQIPIDPNTGKLINGNFKNRLENNINFLKKAPENVVNQYKKQAIDIKSSLEKINQIIDTIS